MADSAAPGTQQLQLAVGDRVVYPNQGVCRVSAIEPMEVAGQRLTFVTMKREEDGAVVRVPQTKVVAIGVRKVASREDAEKIFAFLKSDSDRADLDWKQRARTNLDRMTAGGVLGLAEVVKGLQVLSELRPLPTKERELYDNARHMLVNELSAALGTPEINAEDAIDLILFPPGRERPKRTAEEFKRPAGDEDLELGDDLLLGDDLDLPSDEEPAEPEEEAEEAEPEEEEEAPKKPAAKKKGKKAAAEPDEEEAPRRAALLSDDEVTQPFATAFVPDEEVPEKPKRGRPPKAKTEVAVEVAPKKRGRPPKPKTEAAPAEPKKRGRPPKAKSEAKSTPAKGKKK